MCEVHLLGSVQFCYRNCPASRSMSTEERRLPRRIDRLAVRSIRLRWWCSRCGWPSLRFLCWLPWGTDPSEWLRRRHLQLPKMHNQPICQLLHDQAIHRWLFSKNLCRPKWAWPAEIFQVMSFQCSWLMCSTLGRLLCTSWLRLTPLLRCLRDLLGPDRLCKIPLLLLYNRQYFKNSNQLKMLQSYYWYLLGQFGLHHSKHRSLRVPANSISLSHLWSS